MSDQFSEWDRFYEMYERSLTAAKAMKRYKKRLKSIEARQKRIDKLRRTIIQRTAESSSSTASSQAGASCETSTLSGSDATKSS